MPAPPLPFQIAGTAEPGGSARLSLQKAGTVLSLHTGYTAPPSRRSKPHSAFQRHPLHLFPLVCTGIKILFRHQALLKIWRNAQRREFFANQDNLTQGGGKRSTVLALTFLKPGLILNKTILFYLKWKRILRFRFAAELPSLRQWGKVICESGAFNSFKKRPIPSGMGLSLPKKPFRQTEQVFIPQKSYKNF